MKKSDFRGLCHVILQLGLLAITGTLAYFIYSRINAANWIWSVPLLLLALFVHGSFFWSCTGPGVHELCHKTPFRSNALNEFFLKVYSFISWGNHIFFRVSHSKHHQFTVHDDYDGEVVLPQKLDWQSVGFFVTQLTINPIGIFKKLRFFWGSARNNDSHWKAMGPWMNQVLPESNPMLRREHCNWARTLVLGHLALALLFIVTGHWFLIVVFTFGTYYCGWLSTVLSATQHIGLSPNVSDFRLCCRTYTCSWLPGFLYWNMQYHIEHHMFPAVPFYNLPKLRKAIEQDLPPVKHGLWATWMEVLPIIQRQREDPSYVFVPKLPQQSSSEQAGQYHETGAPLCAGRDKF